MATSERSGTVSLVVNRGFRTVSYLWVWIAVIWAAVATTPFWLRHRSWPATIVIEALVLVPLVESLVLAWCCWRAEGCNAQLVVAADSITIEQPALLHRPIRLSRSIVRTVCIDGDLIAPVGWTVRDPWRPPVQPGPPVPSTSGLLNWDRPPGTLWRLQATSLPREPHNVLVVLTRAYNTGSAPRRWVRFAKASRAEMGLRFSGFYRHTPILAVLAQAQDLREAEAAFADWGNVTREVSADVRAYLTPRTPTLADLRHLFTRLPQEPAHEEEPLSRPSQ